MSTSASQNQSSQLFTKDTKLDKFDSTGLDVVDMKPTLNDTDFRTEIDPKIINKMKTSTGQTVEQIQQSGQQVLLVFLSSLGCCYCQGIIDDLHRSFKRLAQLKTVPILVTHQDEELVESFFSQETKKKYSHFKKIYDLDLFYFKLFQIPEKYVSMEEVTCPRVKGDLQERGCVSDMNYRSILPDGRTGYSLYFQNAQATFLIQNSKIINYYILEKQYERPDFIRLTIDPDLMGAKKSNLFSKFKKAISKKSEIPVKEEEEKFVKTTPIDQESGFFSKAFKYFSSSPKSECENKSEKNSEILYSDIYSNSQYFNYFKLFLSEEYALENGLFVEAVTQYVKSNQDERKEIIDYIMSEFFDPISINELNVSSTFKNNLNERLKNNDLSDDLFKEIKNDVVTGVLFDCFRRFKAHPLFSQMTEESKTKKRYLM